MVRLKLAQSILVLGKMVYFTNICVVLGCGALVIFVIDVSFLVSKISFFINHLTTVNL